MAVKKKDQIKESSPAIGAPKPWVFVLLLFLVYWGINYLDGHSGGFNAQVYAPHKNVRAVENLRVVKSPDELAYEKLVKDTGRSTVPCLYVDDNPMHESSDIIDWLQANQSKLEKVGE